MKQVFINLLKNAMEAMPKGGSVAVSASSPDARTLSVTIQDDGPGMPEEVLKRLGEPFYTTKEKGTGLGIMVSQKIVTEHLGTLDVASLPGQGTTVTVTLPVRDKTDI
ncbi:ATP-binding protein [Paenibacillus sp. P26]|nr:ATP-binding protein [Paenibacillus sp. P26]UUZ92167.1 ATP-binding protein [Paenibacillus sp. P25]